MLVTGEVEAIVRGTLDDGGTFSSYCRIAQHNPVNCVIPAVIRDCHSREFFLVPATSSEGWDREERINQALVTIRLMRRFDITAKVGVLTGMRHETYAAEVRRKGRVGRRPPHRDLRRRGMDSRHTARPRDRRRQLRDRDGECS